MATKPKSAMEKRLEDMERASKDAHSQFESAIENLYAALKLMNKRIR